MRYFPKKNEDPVLEVLIRSKFGTNSVSLYKKEIKRPDLFLEELQDLIKATIKLL